MRVRKPYPYMEFDVFCHNCEKTIVVEGPEDLTKEIQDDEEMFCLVCPVCGNEIKFDGIMGYTLNPEFRELVKHKNTIPTSMPNFDFVFGGFKQKEDLATEMEEPMEPWRRKYPSKVGKLCKNVFPEDERNKPRDKAVQDPMGRIYPFSKDSICTLPKCGGNDRLRPSVQIKNKK